MSWSIDGNACYSANRGIGLGCLLSAVIPPFTAQIRTGEALAGWLVLLSPCRNHGTNRHTGHLWQNADFIRFLPSLADFGTA